MQACRQGHCAASHHHLMVWKSCEMSPPVKDGERKSSRTKTQQELGWGGMPSKPRRVPWTSHGLGAGGGGEGTLCTGNSHVSPIGAGSRWLQSRPEAPGITLPICNKHLTVSKALPPIWGRCLHAQLSGRETEGRVPANRGSAPEPGTMFCEWFSSHNLRASPRPDSASASQEAPPPASRDHGAGVFLPKKG